MKILISGITGLLGIDLAKALSASNDIIGLSSKSTLVGYDVLHLDIRDQEQVFSTISRINPDMVIHTATMTDVDACERAPDEAYQINALGTRNIAVACQRFDTVMCYLSTDYAFSGREAPEKGYTEFDPVDPLSVYAKSKIAGEWYVRHLLNKFFIVRTSWLFGDARKNYISSVADYLRGNKPIKAAVDMISSPTYTADLAVALAALIVTRKYGIFHLSNAGFASRYDIASYVADILQGDKSLIEQIELRALKLLAPRPLFSGLRNYTWQLEGFTALRPWQEAVKAFLVN